MWAFPAQRLSPSKHGRLLANFRHSSRAIQGDDQLIQDITTKDDFGRGVSCHCSNGSKVIPAHTKPESMKATRVMGMSLKSDVTSISATGAEGE
jgi:hypothetical protein